MDDEQFKAYIKNSIMPLYPNASNRPGHQVLLKVDSSPGEMHLQLLSLMRWMGFYMYLCVPNTAHVSQEMNQCYGPFKTQFAINLEQIVDARLDQGKSLSLQPKMVGLPIFGGTDKETGFHVKVSAFQQGFNRRTCTSAWEKVGAVTRDGITRACLNDPQVMVNIGDGLDEVDCRNHAIQEANDLAVHALNSARYNGDFLKATLKKRDEMAEKVITKPNSMARVKALAEAKLHGGCFCATNGGTHSTAEDYWKGAELSVRLTQRDFLKADKKICLQREAIEEKALAILAQEKSVFDLSGGDLDVLLAWHQAPKKKGDKKRDKLEQWVEIRWSMKPPPPYNKWTDKDEQKLTALMSDEVDMADKFFGRELALKEREFEAALVNMSREK
jgi:hypothetical protein